MELVLALLSHSAGCLQEEEARQQRQELDEENQEFRLKKEQYQRDLERLRDAQRRLDRDRDGVQRDLDRLAQVDPGRMNLNSTEDFILFILLKPLSSAERKPEALRQSPQCWKRV